VFLSGNVPVTADGHIPKGKVGADVTTEEAAEHARLVGLHLLAVLKHELGDLDRARRIVKLLGMVNAVPDYVEHSKVINGCSDLFVEVFGEKHARSAPRCTCAARAAPGAPTSRSPGSAPIATSETARRSASPPRTPTFSDIFETDPDTALAWTAAGVNALEVGQEVMT
jgi:enamine deaminase RidA (YjgF/YER057c/UK114 family)